MCMRCNHYRYGKGSQGSEFKLRLILFHSPCADALEKGINQSSPIHGLSSRVVWAVLPWAEINLGEGKLNQPEGTWGSLLLRLLHTWCPNDPIGARESWHDKIFFLVYQFHFELGLCVEKFTAQPKNPSKFLKDLMFNYLNRFWK